MKIKTEMKTETRTEIGIETHQRDRGLRTMSMGVRLKMKCEKMQSASTKSSSVGLNI